MKTPEKEGQVNPKNLLNSDDEIVSPSLEKSPQSSARTNSDKSLPIQEFSIYTVNPNDTLTQIAYFHHMRYFLKLLFNFSVPYLTRINGLDSDILIPGQKLKVLKRTDFTINKDIDEELKNSPKSKKEQKVQTKNSKEKLETLSLQSFLEGILLDVNLIVKKNIQK